MRCKKNTMLDAMSGFVVVVGVRGEGIRIVWLDRYHSAGEAKAKD
jgi:hypothetical protein